jgi:hypothetical protein
MTLPGQGRNDAAKWLDKTARSSGLALVATLVILVVDVAAGWPLGDWRFQAILLVTAVAEAIALFATRALSRRVRGEGVDRSEKFLPAMAGIASLVASLGLMAAFGYLLGGIWRVLLPLGFICLMGVAIARSRSQRRRA